MQEPIVTISPSPARRMFSIAILMLLGGMLIYLAFVVPLASVAWQLILIAIGAGVLLLGDKMRRSTALSIVLTEDNISDSVATDMSVINGEAALADETVFNGTIDAPHDIANAHLMAKRDATGNLELYAGVEILSWAGTTTSPNTYVEFEFNQGVVRVQSGTPWPIHGDRLDGDLLVRMNFTAGGLSSVDFKQWAATSYQVINTVAVNDAESCHGAGTAYIFCTGAPVLAYPAGGHEVWDMDGNSVPSVAPDGFVEVGVDVAGLLGASMDFTSILIRTPNDIALSNFGMMGQWAAISEGGN